MRIPVRSLLRTIVALAVSASATQAVSSVPAAAQAAPPGFTLYSFEGEGVNAPPIALRIDGSRVVGPDTTDAPLRVTGGSLSGERLVVELDTPQGPGRFMGARRGDAYAGLALLEFERARIAVPMTLVPAASERGERGVGREQGKRGGPGEGGEEGEPGEPAKRGGPEPAAPTPAEEPGPDLSALASAPGVSRVQVVPEGVKLAADERRRFVARTFDESGREIVPDSVEWYSAGGTMTEEGEFHANEEGEFLVVAVVDGAVDATPVHVAAPKIVSIAVHEDVPRRLAVGSRVPLEYDAMTAVGRWDLDPAVQVVSSAPRVLAVEGGALLAREPGRATVTLSADQGRQTYDVEVVAAGGGELAITGTPRGPVRTGDVVPLATSVPDARPLWSVAEPGAEILQTGELVAEEPGRYTVLAKLGDRVVTATIEARPRGLEGRVHILGHGLNVGTFTSDLWPVNGYVYLGTHQANQVRTYDVSDPANPLLTDTLTFDARVVNDVKASSDGKLLIGTREGASNRRNGILIFSLEDPAHPKLLSEYTETLTGGVHNVFWVGNLVYAVNDGTGDMHIIDLSDPAAPKEVGRWGIPVNGRQLHDVWVQDGIAYLSYLRDGLVILDVGGAGKGGTPEKPVQVSRIFYPGGPTHSAFRYGDYVFVGDEDFSLAGTVPQIPGLGADPRGPIHVIDVSDLERPRYVARYEVPEAGAHNFWIVDDVLYVGYYQGGIRVVDVSGELRGDLYRQGREITYFLPAAATGEAKLPYAPQVWGVFPMFGPGWKPTGDVLYASDYNSGLWSFTVERVEATPDDERP